MKINQPKPFKDHEVITYLKLIGKAALIVISVIIIYVTIFYLLNRSYDLSNFIFAVGLLVSIMIAFLLNLKLVFGK